MTLAEMFENIKHCRYIRHYHPHGSQSDEEEDLNNSPKIENRKLFFDTFKK